MTEGRTIQSTVTLNISEYNQIYLKAIQHDDLKVGNEKLKEELAIAHKQLEELQQPEEKAPTCEVGMGNMKIIKSSEEFEKKLRAKCLDLDCKNSPYIAIIDGEKLRGTIISNLEDSE